MKKKKIVLSLLLSMTMAFSVGGAVLATAAEGEGLSETKVTEALKEQLKDKTSMDDFVIASWTSIYDTSIKSTREQMAALKESGLTMLMHAELCNDIRTKEGPIAGDRDFWKTLDGYAQELDMNYYYKYRPGDMSGGDDIGFVRSELSDKCVGYYLGDEPPASGVPASAERMRSVRAADPDRYPYYNLYPSYAGTVNLGGTYSEYINRFVDLSGADNMDYLSIDHYPFRDGSDSSTYFSDIETVREVAYRNGKMKTWAMPQTCTWGAMRTTTRGEERWNVYSYLAYGVKALSDFCWVCPGNSDNEGEGFYEGVVYRDGTIRNQEKYDFLSDLNWETRSIGRVLVDLDTAHAYHTLDNAQGVEILPTNYIIKPSAASTDFIVSYMEGKSGTNDHIMLFNKSYKESKTVSFEISESSGITGMEYFNPYTGAYEPVDISSGVLTDTFKEGEGKLYRLIGDVNTDMTVEAPKTTVKGGYYPRGTNTEITCATEGAEIYYTLDGSFPSTESTLYQGEKIILGQQGAGAYALRAAAYKNGSYSSLTEERFFIVDDTVAPEVLDDKSWQATGGGSWSFANGVYTQADAGAGNWNRSYTYTGKKFSDFLVEADISVKQLASGFVGFGMRKPKITSVQDNYMEGFYVAYDSDNNVFIYEGSGGQQRVKESMPSGSSANKTVKLGVLCSQQNIYVYVDGRFVLQLKDKAFDLGAGYISLHAGTMPVSFANVKIYDLSAGKFALGDKQEALAGAEYETSVAVDKYTLYPEVLKLLPNAIRVTDTNGDASDMPVVWSCANYDKNTTGSYYFTGVIQLPDGEKYLNIYNIRAKVSVFVKYVNDYSEINRLIALAESLHEEDFTPESWERMQNYLLAAKDIVADETMAQNAVKVGAWQLEDQIKALVNVNAFTTVLEHELETCKAISADGYTAGSYEVLQQAIAGAESVLATGLSSQEEIDRAAELLISARKGLIAPADKTALGAKIADAEKADTAGKTQASKDRLQAAIASAKALAEKTELTKAQADAATAMLERAMASLVDESGYVQGAGGCGSSIAASASLTLAAGLLTAALILLKKKKVR